MRARKTVRRVSLSVLSLMAIRCVSATVAVVIVTTIIATIGIFSAAPTHITSVMTSQKTVATSIIANAITTIDALRMT